LNFAQVDLGDPFATQSRKKIGADDRMDHTRKVRHNFKDPNVTAKPISFFPTAFKVSQVFVAQRRNWKMFKHSVVRTYPL